MRLQILKSKFDSYFGFMVISFLLLLLSNIPLWILCFFETKHSIQHGTTIFRNPKEEWHAVLVYETKHIFLLSWICSGKALFLRSATFILIFSALTIFFIGLYITTGILGSMDLAVFDWVQSTVDYGYEHLFKSKAKVHPVPAELLDGVKKPVMVEKKVVEEIPQKESRLGLYCLLAAIILFVIERWEP